MKLSKKLVFLCLLFVCTVLVLTACGAPNPYEVNDEMNYNVSIRFDANGGSFTGVDSDSPILVDSYDITGLPKNAQGKVDLPLLDPTDDHRGKDKKTASNPGYFLVGWYQERTETTDASGNKAYTYAKPWDFSKDRFQVDPNGEHTAKEPLLTLYAAWAPAFTIEYYALDSGSLLHTATVDPNAGMEFAVPNWNQETGAMNMYEFPEKEGFTFSAAYFDSQKQKPVEGETVSHPGIIHRENATVENTTLKLYLDYQEGKWFRIHNADQFIANAAPGNSFDIQDDLDFTGKIWPSVLINGKYAGTILGNGHTIQNVTFRHSSLDRLTAGLFGTLTEDAVLQDVHFRNVMFTVEKCSYKPCSFGLLAGVASEEAVLQNVTITESTLKIFEGNLMDKATKFGSVTGSGKMGVDDSQITCLVVDKKDADNVIADIPVSDGYFIVAFDGGVYVPPQETPEEPSENPVQ